MTEQIRQALQTGAGLFWKAFWALQSSCTSSGSMGAEELLR